MPNWHARWSLLLGLLAVAVLPLAVAIAQASPDVRLVYAVAAVPVAVPIGIAAIVLARRGQRLAQVTLGRAGGAGLARAGLVLGFLGLYVGLTTALALGFFGLLTVFAS